MSKALLMVLEDDPLQRRLIKQNLEGEDYTVFDVATGKEALRLLEEFPIEVVIVDYKLNGETGVEVIKRMLKKDPLLTPIVVTAFGNVENAVEAIKMGAYDYIVKPIDFAKFLLVVERALERQKLRREISHLQTTLEEKFSARNFISASSRMEEVARLISKAAKSDATVLISGETGTGKDLVARSIHYSSRRKTKPFLAVNIPSLPETLIESELFGAEKGAYTGAHEKKIGKFEAASGGTLLLDEIGDLTPHVQVKLLRVLQEKEFFRLGSSRPVTVDVRILAATNRDLEQLLQSEEFRQDLYYRLNVIRIHVPPLRERREDILPLVDHCIRKYARQENKSVQGISRDAMKVLLRYDFPGNIRELENIIERAVVFAEDETLRITDLPAGLKDRSEGESASNAKSLPDRIKMLEVRAIKQALQDSGGVKSHAAQALGITDRILRYKMKIYGIAES